jgi:hypothetical protein
VALLSHQSLLTIPETSADLIFVADLRQFSTTSDGA